MRDFTPVIQQTRSGKTFFGFLVKDVRQPTLDIHVNPKVFSSFRANVPARTIARQGNLNVLIGAEGSFYKVLRVDVQ